MVSQTYNDGPSNLSFLGFDSAIDNVELLEMTSAPPVRGVRPTIYA